MADPTLLNGSASQFVGDPAEVTVVSPDSVLLGYAGLIGGESQFLRDVMGCACGALVKTKEAFLNESQAAMAQLMGGVAQVEPCTWLSAYAPMAFYQDFRKNDAPGDGDPMSFFGLFVVDAMTYYYGVDEPFLCNVYPFTYRWTTRHRRWYHWGHVPVGCFGQLPEYFCPPADNFELRDGDCSRKIIYMCNGPGADVCRYCVPGTVTVQPIWYERPDGSGGLYMPIPPIPVGIPAPPPLTGCASVTVNDAQAHDIVQRGGGFQTLHDIVEAYVGETEPNRSEYAQGTRIPNVYNAPDLVPAFNVLGDDDLNQILADLLDRSSDGPLVNMMQGYIKADDPEKKTALIKMLADILRLNALEDGIVIGGEDLLLLEYTKRYVAKACEASRIVTRLILNTEIPVSRFFVNCTEVGVMELVLELAKDILMPTNKVKQVTVRHCDGPYQLPVVSPVAQDPLFPEHDNQLYMQLLLDKLDLLLDCCNPCPDEIDADPIAEEFWGIHAPLHEGTKSLSAEYHDMSSVDIVMVDNAFPKLATFGPPDLLLLAKFVWMFPVAEDPITRYGTEVTYINMAQTTVKAPRGAIGFMVHCYEGVWLNAVVHRHGLWSKPDEPPDLTHGQP